MARQLTGPDAAFIYLENPRSPANSASLTVYDASTAPGGRVGFEDVVRLIRSRLHLAPLFRQKLLRVPMDLDHPYWVDAPDFDLGDHVHEEHLPPPRDWAALCSLTGDLVARPLDLEKPLWEAWFIDGLEDVDALPPEAFALVLKCHHASIDGVSGMEMLTALHDLSADAGPPSAQVDWEPEPAPSTSEILSRAAAVNALRPFRLASVPLPQMPAPRAIVPRTVFNDVVSAQRIVDSATFDLDDLRQVKRAVQGATVNDVLLAVVGGGLRLYLDRTGQLPVPSLVAMVPVSLRVRSDLPEGNQVGAMFVPLATDVGDPRRRLESIRAATARSKATKDAASARDLMAVSEHVPGALVGIAGRFASDFGLASTASPPYNTVVTNVPGPPQPIYLAGARMASIHPLGMVHDAMGLFHAATSYCGSVFLSVNADPEMLPDPPGYMECLRHAFSELRAATI